MINFVGKEHRELTLVQVSIFRKIMHPLRYWRSFFIMGLIDSQHITFFNYNRVALVKDRLKD